jgi:predicted transposase/invertase (TIGR01784 family)
MNFCIFVRRNKTEKLMKFADIKNDIAFRKIFSNETKTEILISFLNAVLKLEGEKQISWVEILNPYQLPRMAGSKSTILDVRAKDKAGNSYIVEMQITDKKGLDKRITFYSARGYASQLDASENYYKLKPVIFIGILNFEYLQSPHYLSRHLILDAETQEHKLKDLEFSFIELPKFKKKKEELETLIEKWVFFIKDAENLDVIPENVNDEGLKSAYQEADRHTWTKEELEEYEYARMRETDEIAEKLLVEEKAQMKKAIEIAKNLIKLGLDNEVISKATGLTHAQIDQLRAEG